jgi:hypothetical protein
VPLSLAAQEPDVCEMECCVATGHCCCATRHAYVAGHLPKPDEVTLNFQTELTTPCPTTCAGATGSGQIYLPRAQHVASPFALMAVVSLAHGWQLSLPTRSFVTQHSAPRAPPLQ